MNKFLQLFFILCMVVVITACDKKKPPEYVEYPPEEMYNEALGFFKEGKYKKAAPAFEEVEKIHPYSDWARRAQIMAAYVYYLSDDYANAILNLDRFIDLYPNDNQTQYARYLKAMSFYEQISDVRRDQDFTYQALKELDNIITLYPDSDYARDARLKRDLAVNHLAGKEMEVGRFYIIRADWAAAINRFRIVVDQFQTTTHVPEAMARLVELYLTIGVRDEAVRIGAVLGANYPDSYYYKWAFALLNNKPVPAFEPDKETPKKTFVKTIAPTQ